MAITPMDWDDRRKVEWKFVGIAVLGILIIAANSFVSSREGYQEGYDAGKAYYLSQNVLPECQEDEYLYPARDYKGPGGNVPADYGCVHMDTATAKVIIYTLVALGEITPDQAEAYFTSEGGPRLDPPEE